MRFQRRRWLWVCGLLSCFLNQIDSRLCCPHVAPPGGLAVSRQMAKAIELSALSEYQEENCTTRIVLRYHFEGCYFEGTCCVQDLRRRVRVWFGYYYSRNVCSY